ncbi:hypothetical protein AA23498_1634 [Acetobacter nitrogenifigens DSM 23921 = NBRC 105050]|uniref:Oxidoreductase n=1 Tax=Acetobacter nitrogenifigens DSM 23921 = NBRC 105050 TaxID=1120919 RepID=A0A511XB68_9PROT|nr:DUF934 domain-containing protein [Acetobacter nitrogenifigens]GBQ93098.1 hypothetical protein AA23498_1634 [Acetobacter nitrogenifigens DSM 23921 = NBRC 105050]GEN60217.1 oxidoreductase [Acetobacter nitrogenifigens DSM 23921 = NBRC 105050]
MPLLENGRAVADRWTYAVEGQPLGEGPVIVPSSRLSEGLGRAGGELGVLLAPDEAAETLRAALARLSLVAVRFPIFRDGRAFSQARALREHLHFKGEVRAVGHILPDQYEFLLRCGVTTVEAPENADISVWNAALQRFSVAMQPSIAPEKATGFGLRRFLDAAG